MISTPYIHAGTRNISQAFQGILFDAYGVFWNGNQQGLLPGSQDVMEHLVSTGKSVGVLSNSTQLSTKEIKKLENHGLILGEHYHFLITSGEITKRTLGTGDLPFATPTGKFWIFGGIHPKYSSPLTLFEGSPFNETKDVSEADFIYISIPHINGEDQLDPSVFEEEVEALRKTNLPMVCANPDRFAHEGSPPRAVVRQGSIAQLYEQFGGKVFYFGKPHALAFTAAMDQFQEKGIHDPEQILMVGDTPETDIRGANQFGMASALITKTGIMSERLTTSDMQQVMTQLPESDRPTFMIERI